MQAKKNLLIMTKYAAYLRSTTMRLVGPGAVAQLAFDGGGSSNNVFLVPCQHNIFSPSASFKDKVLPFSE